MPVRIVCRPMGEAPDWVRDAWIGLELPLATQELVTVRTVGVLRQGRTWWTAILSWWLDPPVRQMVTITGYRVTARRAVDILAETQPAAADWWRENAMDLLAQGGDFIFDAPCCERIG